MRVLILLDETSWRGMADRVPALLPAGSTAVLVYTGVDPAAGELVLAEAEAAFGLPTERLPATGRDPRVDVLEQVGADDLLVMARDPSRELGPASIDPVVRHLLDHAACPVLVVWPAAPRVAVASSHWAHPGPPPPPPPPHLHPPHVHPPHHAPPPPPPPPGEERLPYS